MKTTNVKLAIVLGALLLTAGQALAGNWGYEGQEGVYTPDEWSHADKAYAACEATPESKQSPIDIVPAMAVEGEYVLRTSYEGDLASASNNGHAVVVSGVRYMELGEEMDRNDLVQFHFHTLSEHTVNGKHYDMEMHLVHADADMNLAVLGVFIKAGEENEALEEVFAHLPHASHDGHGESVTAELVSNYERLLPKNRDFWHYSGSLTTPPCSEGVKWFVLKQPIEMSAEQIAHYRALYSENGLQYDTNRPVQDFGTARGDLISIDVDRHDD